MKRFLCAATALLTVFALLSSPVFAEERITARVRADGVGLIGQLFSLGDQIEVLEQSDGYYVVQGETGLLLVESWLVRREGEPAPEAYTGFALQGAAVYANGYLEGETLAVLSLNTPLTVEDSFGRVSRITLQNGTVGYMSTDKVSKTKIVYSGGSGGQDGGDIGLGSPAGQEIQVNRLLLRFHGEDQPFAPGLGTILAAAAEGYTAVLSRGDMVRVTEKGEDICTVQAGELSGRLPTRLLAFEDEPEFAAFDGFAKGNAPLHRHWRMLDETTNLSLNTRLHVVDQVGNVYMVELAEGMAFVPVDMVSRNQITYTPSNDWTDPTM